MRRAPSRIADPPPQEAALDHTKIRATRDEAASQPDLPVYVLTCADAAYRVKVVQAGIVRPIRMAACLK